MQIDSCIIQKVDSGEESAHRSFAQPTACLHVPAALTREDAKHEGLQPRTSERHAVGCCDELGGLCPSHSSRLRCT